jgi:hypothetical protein
MLTFGLIKVDVEGQEQALFLGATQILKCDRPT